MSRDYTPQYFLAALGNGGLSVSFFTYLLFMVPHPDTPMVTFRDIAPVFAARTFVPSALVGLALAAILFFAFKHFQLLFWNIRNYRKFKRTDAFSRLRQSPGEVSLMAIPLTLAMSINVLFVLGATFIPGLWDWVEWLFPFAIAGFLIIGGYGIKIFIAFLSRIAIEGTDTAQKNNGLGHMIAVFAFSMISVGLAGPAAMSHQLAVSATAMFFAILFAAISILLAIVQLVLGFRSIIKQGIAKEAGATLWIMIPILTLLGIAFVRLFSGVYHHFLHTQAAPFLLFLVLSALFSLQLFFGLLGYVVLMKTKYFRDFIYGEEKNAGSYALICPGVAFFVLGMFFIYWGLVKTGLIEPFSIPHFVMLAPLVLIQFKTIQVLFRLNQKLIYTG